MIELPPGCRARFEPVRVLASGGFGTAVLCRQLDLDRLVVLKVLHGSAEEAGDLSARFRAEARITSRLQHPNIVRLLDWGADDAVPWIAYEHIDGPTLAEVLQQGGPLDPPAAVALGIQLARALGAAHERDIHHRDLKPANVMRAADGEYKLIDFGIARWSGDAGVRTAAGVVVGTPEYMPPEYVRGEPFTARSDLYSLGVLLYECLTGRQPFAGPQPAAVLRHHLMTPPPAPRSIRREIPVDLERIMLSLLEKDPARRTANSDELIRQLEALEGERPAGIVTPVTPLDRPAGGTGLASTRILAAPPGPGMPGIVSAPATKAARSLVTRSVIGITGLLMFLGGWLVAPRRPPAAPSPAISPATVPAVDRLSPVERVGQVNASMRLVSVGRSVSVLLLRSDVPGWIHVHAAELPGGKVRAGEDLSPDRVPPDARWTTLTLHPERGGPRLVHRHVLPWSGTEVQRVLKISRSADPQAEGLRLLGDQRLTADELARQAGHARDARREAARQKPRSEHDPGLFIGSPLHIALSELEYFCEPAVELGREIERMDPECAALAINVLAHRADETARHRILAILPTLIEREGNEAWGSVVHHAIQSLASLDDEDDAITFWENVRISRLYQHSRDGIMTLSALAARFPVLRRRLTLDLDPALDPGERPLTNLDDQRFLAAASALWLSEAPERVDILGPRIRHPQKLNPDSWKRLLLYRDDELALLYDPGRADASWIERASRLDFLEGLAAQRQAALADAAFERFQAAGAAAPPLLAIATGLAPLSAPALARLEKRIAGPDGALWALARARQAFSARGGLPDGTVPLMHEGNQNVLALALGLSGQKGARATLESWILDPARDPEARATAAVAIAFGHPDAWPALRARLPATVPPPLPIAVEEVDRWLALPSRPRYDPVHAPRERPGDREGARTFLLGSSIREITMPTGRWYRHEAKIEKPRLFGWWRPTAGAPYRPASSLPRLVAMSSSFLHPAGDLNQSTGEPVFFDASFTGSAELVLSVPEDSRVQEPCLIWGIVGQDEK